MQADYSSREKLLTELHTRTEGKVSRRKRRVVVLADNNSTVVVKPIRWARVTPARGG